MIGRVRTGVPGLDDMLSGGFIEGSAVLLIGSPGTGKTTLGMQYLYNGVVEHDEPGLLISFEEFPHALLRDAQSHGWDLRALEDANKLRIIYTSPQIFLSSLQSPDSSLNQMILKWGVRRIVLDSVSHFGQLTSDPTELRTIYGTLVNGFKREALTSILTCEASKSWLKADRAKLAYLVDAVLLTRYVEVDSAMERAIVVLKMRASAHTQDIHRFEICPQGIVVREKFQGLQHLLTGMSQRTAPPR